MQDSDTAGDTEIRHSPSEVRLAIMRARQNSSVKQVTLISTSASATEAQGLADCCTKTAREEALGQVAGKSAFLARCMFSL